MKCHLQYLPPCMTVSPMLLGANLDDDFSGVDPSGHGCGQMGPPAEGTCNHSNHQCNTHLLCWLAFVMCMAKSLHLKKYVLTVVLCLTSSNAFSLCVCVNQSRCNGHQS